MTRELLEYQNIIESQIAQVGRWVMLVVMRSGIDQVPDQNEYIGEIVAGAS